MDGLPLADAETRSLFLQWLETFSTYVREVDYASARPLFHPQMIAFGTHRDVLRDRETWITTQWDNVWPRTTDFRFDPDSTQVLASADGTLAVVIAVWSSTGYHTDGQPFERPGRATMVFHRSGQGWTGVHSHLSLNRGVPQTSHADREVKAR